MLRVRVIGQLVSTIKHFRAEGAVELGQLAALQSLMSPQVVHPLVSLAAFPAHETLLVHRHCRAAMIDKMPRCSGHVQIAGVQFQSAEFVRESAAWNTKRFCYSHKIDDSSM